MERKIGEIFEYNGEWYQCVGGTCRNCSFYYDTVCKNITTIGSTNLGNCHCSLRTDHKSVIFKKLEKVGEPYVKRVSDGTFSTFQRYKVYNSVILPKEPYIYCNFIDGTIEIEIKQNKEDMEEKNNGNTPLNVLTDKYVNGDICYDDFEKEVKALYSCKEEIKPNLKEFDLEAAKAGKPVCTRDGRKARIICFDKITCKNYKELKIIALVREKDNEDIHVYNNNGKKYLEDSPIDLMMLPEKKEGWVNVYKERIYDTKEEAIEATYDGVTYIDTIKISWEE